MSGNWSARLEYDYIDLAHRTYDLSGFGLPGLNVDPNINLVKIGLNYRFGDTPPWAAPASANDKTALAGIGRLECPRPDDLYSNGLSGIPLALCGHQQPSRRWTDPARPGPRRPFSACGCGRAANSISTRNWRRASASTARSAWPAFRTARRKRPAPRSRKSVRSAITFSQTFGLGGEQEDVAGRPQSTAGQTRHRSHHADCRTVRGRRFLRQQRLRATIRARIS